MKKIIALVFSATMLITLISSCSKNDDTVNTSTCPQHYTGVNCSQQITPSKIRITQIKVTRFPCLDGGSDWDLFGGSNPDIKVAVYNGTQNIYVSSSIVIDASCIAPNYNFPCSIDVNSTDSYTFGLFDDDSASDDFMGGVIQKLYSSTSGFPTSITVDASAGVAFQLTVEYTW